MPENTTRNTTRRQGTSSRSAGRSLPGVPSTLAGGSAPQRSTTRYPPTAPTPQSTPGRPEGTSVFAPSDPNARSNAIRLARRDAFRNARVNYGPAQGTRTTAPAPNVGPFQSVGFLPQRNPKYRQPQGMADRAQALLGPIGQLYEGQLTRADVPLLEVGLNMQQVLQTLEDRDRAYGLLEGAEGSVGQSRASTIARELAITRAEAPGPFSNQELDAQRTAITESGALGHQEARAQALAELAMRGAGGSTAAFQLARLQQSQAAQTQQQLSGFEMAVAEAREDAQRQSLAQLFGISGQEEERKLNLQTLMARLLAETERAPLDFSGLIASPPGGAYIVGQQAF